MKYIYSLTTLVFFWLNFLLAQPGTLDVSFGNNGIVRTDFGSGKLNSSGRQVLDQPGGSMLVLVESEDGLTILAKLLPDGSRDLSYGTFGYSYPLFITGAVAAVQADGKVVIAGTTEDRSYTYLGETDLLVARLNSDGTIDNSFNGDGRVITSFGMMEETKSLTIRDDGRIILISMTDDYWFSVSAFNPDGSFDQSFGTNGKYKYSIEGYTGATVQTDGKIILTNYSFSLGGYYVFRLNTDGTNDDTFNSTTFSDVGIQSISLQDDGKILVAGYTQIDPSSFFLERFGADGTPDAGFGTDGIVTTDFHEGGSIPTSITVQDNGKIIVSGYTVVTATNYTYTVARYNTDGVPDDSFSDDGMQIVTFGDGAYRTYITTETADEKLLVAYSDNGQFAVARLNADGSLDDTFDQDGMLHDGIIMGSTFYLGSAIQSDGKLVTAGYAFNRTNTDLAVARYNSDGSLDPTFSSDGKQVNDVSSSNDTAYAVVIQANDKIIVAGSAIARFGPDGTLDASYGNNGIIASGNWRGAVLQTDGKLLVAGAGVGRFNTDGSPDLSFGNSGIVSGGKWYSIVLQPDGKIVVAGGVGNFEIARYNSDGSPDNSFSGDGFESTHIHEDPGAPEDFYAGHARAVAIQSNGKIVVTGDWHYNYRGYTSFFALSRYNTDGSLDNSFSDDGILLSVPGYATSIVIQNDGKIIAAGSSNDEYQFVDNVYSDFKIVRYNADGSPDLEFNGTGSQITSTGSSYSIIQSLALYDEKLYATGHGRFPNNLGLVARFLNVAAGPVPLNLISLNAVLKDAGRLVSWSTANESNVSHYEIERSTNPVRGFEKISSINAYNQSSNNYSYIDNAVVEEDICYYRLKIYDVDGKITYSRIVSVRNIRNRYVISIYPNPARDYINVSLQQEVQNASIIIYSSSGKAVLKRSNISGQNFQFDISTLPAGMYSILLAEGDRFSIIKFLK